MFCIYCGTEIENTSLFCPHCGEKIVYKNKINSRCIGIAIVMLVIVIAVFVILFIKKSSGSNIVGESDLNYVRIGLDQKIYFKQNALVVHGNTLCWKGEDTLLEDFIDIDYPLETWYVYNYMENGDLTSYEIIYSVQSYDDSSKLKRYYYDDSYESMYVDDSEWFAITFSPLIVDSPYTNYDSCIQFYEDKYGKSKILYFL